MKLTHEATPVHGMRWHEEPGPRGLCWWQYWRGVHHTWKWRGITVCTALRRRNRPTYELIKRITGER